MKFRNLLFLGFLPFLAVSCSTPFSSGGAGGIFKTTNSGADWVAINKTTVETVGKNGKITTEVGTDLVEADVRNLAWSLAGPKRLYAAAAKKGVYVSENEGESWKVLLPSVNASVVVADPVDSQKIFVGGASGASGRILTTQDGGKTWGVVYADSQQGIVQTLSVHSNATWIAAGLSTGSVLISKDKGLSWTLAYNLDRNVAQVYWQGNDLYILQSQDGLFVAKGGGGDLVDLTASIKTSPNLPDSSGPRIQSANVVPKPDEFWQIAFSPNSGNVIYLATNVGVFSTQNSGGNWNFLALPVEDISNQSAVRAIASGFSSGRVVAAVEGNVYFTSNGGQSWEVHAVAQGGRIRYILLDRDQPKTLYVGAERIR